MADNYMTFNDAVEVLTPYAEKINTIKPESITWAAYQLLTSEQKAAKRYLITDYPSPTGYVNKLSDLEDVSINSQTLSNGQVPVYNNTNEVWENKTILENSLTSTATDVALTAAQGKVLQDTKQAKTLTTPLTINDTQETTVEGALGGLNDYGDAIISGLSNRNLVINWDFTHPINETGATSGTFAPVREILGKWKTDYSGDGSRTYAITSQGLQINNDQAAVGFVKQTFETALDASKTYTLTIEFSDNHKETVTGDLNALLYTEYYSGISLQCTDTYVQLRIQASAGGTVAHVKVETGNISTLANDVAPNQTLELLKCQNANVSGLSNENLLDNGWFTVNQRGFTSHTMDTYYFPTADRWLGISSDYGGVLTLGASGMNFNKEGYSSPFYLTQKMEGLAVGKVYTLSVLFSDGTIEHGTGIINSTSDYVEFEFSGSRGKARIYYLVSWSQWLTDIVAYAGANFTVRAIKLEVGSKSTLAHDVAPNYTAELLKCQRYFKVALNDTWNVGICIAMATDTIEFYYFSDIPMRVAPSVSTVGSITAVKIADGSEVAISSVEGSFDINAKNGRINFKTSTTLTIRDLYILRMNNAKVMLSADL